jgi:glycosyltransferase involved in cell wall biosynthesis
MKVGIHLGSMDPRLGGGFTIEQEIVREIFRKRGQTHHSFTFFSVSGSDFVNGDSERPDIISLQPTVYERLKLKLSVIYNHVIKWLGRSRYLGINMQLAPAVDSYDQLYFRKLINYDIDFIIYLSQCDCLTKDIPYATIVWDLQHRLQPYFPEISRAGSWHMREEGFLTLLQRASFVIVGTQEGKKEVAEFYQIPAGRIIILPHPVPSDALETTVTNPDDVLKKYSIQQEYLFYPAQFWPHKNHILILKALSLLREQHNLKLSVVFTGCDYGNLQFVKEYILSLGLQTQVKFLGFLPRTEVIALYRKTLALVYVTFFGPENMPPLEAFAIGCPVIASRVAGAEEQLGEAAILIDPKSEQELADAILRLYSNSTLRTSLIQRGKERAKKFTASDFVSGIFSMLDDFEKIRRCWK